MLDYARRLLGSLGVTAASALPEAAPAPSTPVQRALAGALSALGSLAPGTVLPGLELLTERSEHYGFAPPTDVSAGGATRLLRCADGHVAFALARPDDVASVPALVEAAAAGPWAATSERESAWESAWESASRWASTRPAADVRDRAVLLGLACSVPGETVADLPWLITPKPYAGRRRPCVVDLSSLWAGPLCSSLLAVLGCDVVKVEDPTRPDGARGNPGWFRRLYPSATFVSFEDLADLLSAADVVIEASRPRALQHRGIRAEDFAGVWVSITGYGRDQPDRIGYGDDAAVAGGLVGPGPSFVGDAVADPLTGVHAALAAWALLSTGRGGLVDIALARTAATAAAAAPAAAAAAAAPVAGR